MSLKQALPLSFPEQNGRRDSCFMKTILLLVMIHQLLRPVQSVNGVIWDKKLKDFVPIFNIPAFAAVNDELLSQSRREELYNFKKKIVRFTYFEESNLIFGKSNGTEVTGVIGEIWIMLSEYLNFTLKPILTDEHGAGSSGDDGIYETGLLKYIQENKTDVISRMSANSKRLRITQMLMPLWKTEYRLYIRREVIHLRMWMLKLFSQRVWHAVLMTYFLLTICSYLSHTVESKITHKKLDIDLNDHLFYNFGMICGQSYFPSTATRSSKLVELWVGLFSFLIRTAFSALLIRYMTQTTVIPPFNDLKSLLDSTSYNILVLEDSLPHAFFQRRLWSDYAKAMDMKRCISFSSVEDLYKRACSTDKLYAIYQGEDIKKARGVYTCRLNPVGIPLQNAWIVSGISKTFRHKRSIDIGLLRLHELGFMNILKQRWIDSKNVEEEAPNVIEPITLEQVYLILMIFIGGLLISFIIFLFENLIFYCEIN
ncbi:hypothetical protein E2986_01391 [Frieseomelitta varia]|uniref:Uncharacterized protein n=1 Tax=Frieseomelitta varia TaxID=561572 RepID=A0A833RRV9_9HYME|nr:uncharacterized protein LOC122536192 [Frieseomelitta varia]KAF3421847.1 hypothetical protein E2986_01391 [Frieseomelitta varia]